MGRIERRQKGKEEIRKSIMDTALNIAVSEGWDAVTIRKIAEAIEYTPPIVYEHFKNKEDLFREIELMGHRMLNNDDDVLLSTSNPKESLLLLSIRHWDFAFQNRELYQLMFSFSKPLINDEIEKIISSKKKLFFELVHNTELAEELMFNWICLLHGYIFHVMQMEMPLELIQFSPKKLFINAVERFLDSL